MPKALFSLQSKYSDVYLKLFSYLPKNTKKEHHFIFFYWSNVRLTDKIVSHLLYLFVFVYDRKPSESKSAAK